MLEYVVLYESDTGNTKQLAVQIFSALPGNSKDLVDLSNYHVVPDAETYFIGFPIHKGTCDMDIVDFLDNVDRKNIALFCTCGMGTGTGYYAEIEKRVSVWVTEDNRYLGMFLCQGKMPQRVRQKYESMINEENDKQIRQMIRNFDEAMIHPNDSDYVSAKAFVAECLSKIQVVL